MVFICHDFRYCNYGIFKRNLHQGPIINLLYNIHATVCFLHVIQFLCLNYTYFMINPLTIDERCEEPVNTEPISLHILSINKKSIM